MVRRSGRGQPLLSNELKSASEKQTKYTWEGEELLRRVTSERDIGNILIDKDDLDVLESYFYNGLIRTRPSPTSKSRSKRKAESSVKRPPSPTQEVFRIGDTILVNTTGSSSVAVIAAMWQIYDPEESLPEEHEIFDMQVLIHWFLQANAKNMPNSRASREHAEVRTLHCIFEFIPYVSQKERNLLRNWRNAHHKPRTYHRALQSHLIT